MLALRAEQPRRGNVRRAAPRFPLAGWALVPRMGRVNSLADLMANNRRWSEENRRRDPRYFEKLWRQQNPRFLWIGCSDSRVPANDIVGLQPGELFVHRNVANLVVPTDTNCLSVIQFAVEILGVRHIIVCGHYNCSGVHAALRGDHLGLADNWLCHVDAIRQKHAALLRGLTDEQRRVDLLCELNVIEQVVHVCETKIAQDAWERGQELKVHGWIYGLRDGLLRDLDATTDRSFDIQASYRRALARLK